jgi:hypothetical protein
VTGGKYANPDTRIAIEYQGIFGARNTSHAGITGLKRDYRKWTEISLLGWYLILIDAESVETGEAIAWVERALKSGRELIGI